MRRSVRVRTGKRARSPEPADPPPRLVTAPPTRGRPPMPQRTVKPQRAAASRPPHTATPPRMATPPRRASTPPRRASTPPQRASTRRPASTQRRTASVAIEPSSWQLAMEARMERSEQTLAGITDVLTQLVDKLPAAAGAPQLAAPLPPATSPQIVASTSHVEQPRLDNLAGECSAVAVPWASAASVAQSGNTCIGDDPSGASPGLPIHMHVAEKEKQKIWADVYVDLIALLNENIEDEHYALAVTSGGGGHRPEIYIAPRRKNVFRSFSQWAKAFQVFLSIYLSKPSRAADAPALLKYQQTVQNIAERGGAWRSYDESFRSMRTAQGWRWNMVHWELWMKAMQPLPVPHHVKAAGQPAFLNKERADGRPRPRNVCFKFNRGQACNPNACAYTHSCSACSGSHPATRCNGRPQLPAREAARR